MNNKENYVYGLDVLRFTAALSVALFHLTYVNPAGLPIFPLGWLGVEIFFVISGVVIANSAANSTASRFLTGRFLRLYPAAWIAGVISFAVLLLHPWSVYKEMGISVVPQAGALLRSLTLVGDYFIASAYWTLPVELSFYVLVVFSLLSGGRVGLLTIARLLVLISIPFVVGVFCHVQGWIHLPWLDFGFGLKNALLVQHGPFFALGIFVWWRGEKRRFGTIDRAAAGIAVFLAVLMAATGATNKYPGYLERVDAHASLGFLIASSVCIFLAGFLAICLSVIYREKLALPEQLKRLLRVLGMMTYPFYLLHEVLGGAVMHHAQAWGMPFALQLGLALALAGASAYLIAMFAEPWLRDQLRAVIALLSTRTGKSTVA